MRKQGLLTYQHRCIITSISRPQHDSNDIMLQPLQAKRKRGCTIGLDHNNANDGAKKIKTGRVQPEAVQATAVEPMAEQAPDKGGGLGAGASKATKQQQRELRVVQASAIVRLDNIFLNNQNAKAQAAGSLYERVFF